MLNAYKFKTTESLRIHQDRSGNPKSHTYVPHFHFQQQLAHIRNVINFPTYLPHTLSIYKKLLLEIRFFQTHIFRKKNIFSIESQGKAHTDKRSFSGRNIFSIDSLGKAHKVKHAFSDKKVFSIDSRTVHRDTALRKKNTHTTFK